MINTEEIRMDEAWSHKPYYPFYYKNLRAEQNRNIFEALDALSLKESPSQIIEIGASSGGFTKILEDHPISEKAKVYSFELNDFNPNAKYSDKVIQVKGNCFHLEDAIGILIKKQGTTILFCDGGDKNLEINTFSKYLKVGDIIMGHDYAPTKEIWEKDINGKIWDWHETWDSAVQEVCDYYNLQPYLHEEFSKAVWKCLKKF